MKKGKSQLLTAAAFTVGMLAVCGEASAQDAATSTAPTDEADASSGDASGDIIVTARRRAERLQDVPIAVSSFTGDDLRDKGIVNVTDLERTAPSLKFNQQMGGSTSQTVSLRGQSQTDILLNTDSSVGVYVDEVNVPRTINLRSALFDVARIEVLRGPQGTLYGRNTTGGAISIISQAPDFDGVHGYAEASYGNYDDFKIGGAINLPLVEDRISLRLAGQHRQHDGYSTDRFSGIDLSDEKADFLRGSVLIQPTDNLEINWVTDWNRSRDNGFATQIRTIGAPPFGTTSHVTTGLINYSVFKGYLNPADIPGAANGNTPGATFVSGLNAGYADLLTLTTGNGIGFRETTYGGPYPNGALNPGNEITSWGTGLRMSLELGSVTLKSVTGYRRLKRDSTTDLDATPAPTLQSWQNTKADFFSQEFQLVGNAANDNLVYQLGVYYSHEKGTEISGNIAVRSINPNNPTIAIGDITNESYAAYAQATYKLTPELSLTGGARYTVEKKELVSHNQVFSAALNAFRCTVPPGNLPITACSGTVGDTFKKPSWLVSLDYKPNHDVLFYGKASQSFRGGGTNLRATDAAAFEAFEPETAREYELGMKSDLLDGLLRLNLAAYLTKYSKIQRQTVIPTSTGGVTVSVKNAASATIKGLEAEAILRPATGLTLSGTANFIDPEYDRFVDLDPVTRLPRDRSSEDFGSFNGVPRTQLSGSVRYELPIGDGTLAMQGNVYYQGRTRSLTLDVDKTFDRADVDMPAYTLLSARLSYRFANDMEIAVFGENLANKKYFTGTLDVSSLGYLLGSIGNPRTYGISLRIPFGNE